MTLGLEPTKGQIEPESPLGAKLHTPHRADGARCNYIAPYRPDVQYAAKEISRRMSSPTDVGPAALKRRARFFLGRKRLVLLYP